MGQFNSRLRWVLVAVTVSIILCLHTDAGCALISPVAGKTGNGESIQNTPIVQGSLDILTADTTVGPTEQTLKKFICDNGFFTATIPSGWDKSEEIILGRQEKRYGVDLAAPDRAEGAATFISLIYFGPDHSLFKTYKEYIAKNMELPRKKQGEKAAGPRDIVFNGRKAITFETERYMTIPPYAARPATVLIYQKQIVIPAKEGFYALILESPKSAADKYQKIFDAIGASFRIKG